MKVLWRKSAIQSLLELDKWRATVELPHISPYLKASFEFYFQLIDYSVYILGKTVYIKSYPVDLRMVIISVGKSDPYKVFFRLTIEILRSF